MRTCWTGFVVALVIATPTSARAYELKKSSTGAALHWDAGTTELVIAVESATALAAIATWNAGLDGTEVELSAVDSAGSAVPTDAGDGVNTIRWGDGEDPDLERGVLGLTFISYGTSTGAIRDADIVLNARDFAWTTKPSVCANEYDVQSALTHELGHLLGLAHSLGHHEAVMFPTGDACETIKRELAGDDRAGLDALYRTAMPPDAGGCSAGGSPGIALGLALAALGRRRRRALATVACAIAIATLQPRVVEAARLRHLEIAELAGDAELVLRGTVIAVAVVRDGALVTETVIAVERCVGETARCRDALVVVRSRGGELGDEGLWVDAEARPAFGAEVVVFLRTDVRGRLRVLGGVQGLFAVVHRDGAVFAARDLRAHEVLDRDAWHHGEREELAMSELGL